MYVTVYVEAPGVLVDGVTWPVAEFTDKPTAELYVPAAPTKLDVAIPWGVEIELQKPGAAYAKLPAGCLVMLIAAVLLAEEHPIELVATQ